VCAAFSVPDVTVFASRWHALHNPSVPAAAPAVPNPFPEDGLERSVKFSAFAFTLPTTIRPPPDGKTDVAGFGACQFVAIPPHVGIEYVYPFPAPNGPTFPGNSCARSDVWYLWHDVHNCCAGAFPLTG